jgi:antitoxin (DNA-binding transcriptional repressor) of toxin-antitoxin stability system
MTVDIEQAKSSLKELIAKSALGERVFITEGHQQVAELVPVPPGKSVPVFGSCKGMLTILSDDEEHLKDFDGYLE